jgi:thiamine kinase-like enzyme
MAPVRSKAALAQPARLEGDLRAVGADLVALLSHVPGWRAADGVVDASQATLRQLGGAMSNHVFRLTSSRAGAQPLLLRIYGCAAEGSDADAAALFSRAAEVATAEAVAALGVGPNVFVSFRNGRLEELLDAAPLSAPAMRSPAVASAVAAELARFHAGAAACGRLGGGACALWPRLRRWLALARDAAASQPPGAARDALRARLDAQPAALDALEATLAPWAASGAPGAATVFAHADLQHNNILALAHPSTSVALVDYEYALRAPAAFDIGNHFCEWAADYADDAPGGMLNYPERYPGRAAREAFCAAYLGAGATAAHAAALAAAADAHALASHVHWALWGVVQSRASSVDFDFIAYAHARFDELDRHVARLQAEAAEAAEAAGA